MSGNLRRRFGEHQRGESQSTKGRRPWNLIYYEAYLEEQDAVGREIFLKSGSGRRFLDKQLKNHFILHPRREAT
jgi:putative endonuclease